jgi:hypothetical protein
VLVAQTCNPSYLEGRFQEDLVLNPAGKYFTRLYLEKKTIPKKGLVEWLKV